MTKGLDNSEYASLQERITKDQKENKASKKQIAQWTNTHQMTKHADIWWKEDQIVCHGSAGTPLGTHANGEASGSKEARPALRT
jgi:hypothetical protein